MNPRFLVLEKATAEKVMDFYNRGYTEADKKAPGQAMSKLWKHVKNIRTPKVRDAYANLPIATE